jgi:hypothetical protein
MPRSFADFIQLIISSLSDEELQGCLVYAGARSLRKGEILQLPGVRVEATVTSYLAFIDRQPAANWGHPARYVIVPQQGGEAQIIEARLPPFQSGSRLNWRLVYQGTNVPDALVPQLFTKSKSATRKEP